MSEVPLYCNSAQVGFTLLNAATLDTEVGVQTQTQCTHDSDVGVCCSKW